MSHTTDDKDFFAFLRKHLNLTPKEKKGVRIRIDLHMEAIPEEFKRPHIPHLDSQMNYLKFRLNAMRKMTTNTNLLVEIVCGKGQGILIKEVIRYLDHVPWVKIVNVTEACVYITCH